jgi:hypothetical protein
MSTNLPDALLRIHRDTLMAQLLDVAREPDERIRQLRTINTIVYYLSEIGIDAALVQPLVSVALGMADDLQGNNLKPLTESQPLAACAAAVDLLKDAGVSSGDAARLIARAAGDGLTAGTLAEFRKNIGKGRVRPEAKEFYHRCIAENRKRFEGLTPSERKAAVLKSIRMISGKV